LKTGSVMPKGCPLKKRSITSQLLWATRPNIRLSSAVPVIMLNLDICRSRRTMAQGQIFALLLGARRVASTKFPRNKTQKMMAAEKKTSTLVFRIVV
jgi:hypothetical protein